MNSPPPIFPKGEAASAADHPESAFPANPLKDRAHAANVETALTDEMRRLAAFITESAIRLQSVGEHASDDLGKLVLGAQRLFYLEFSNAILKSMNRCRSLSEYADNLNKLELSLGEAFREVVMDGRKFACVALTDEAAREFFRAHQGGEQGRDVHERVPLDDGEVA